jgi:bifunctional NMN adenylyltransferase/nudix hydrolase
MIRNWLNSVNPQAIVKPINDYLYSDNKWITQVEDICYTLFNKNECEFTIVGHHKDESSYYLDIFPTWKVHETPEYANGISATEIRKVIFNNIDAFSLKEYLQSVTSREISQDIIDNYIDCQLYQDLLEEKQYFEREDKKFANYPYKDTLKFNCSDAVVVCDGNILLIERERAPGKGTFALPGGFTNTNETYEQCAIRELYEETNLKLPLKVLKGSLKRSKIFDNPKRNEGIPRITNAFYFGIQPDSTKSGHSKLPKVKGSDDAASAKWFSLAEVRNMTLFDDHADIIDYFVNSF